MTPLHPSAAALRHAGAAAGILLLSWIAFASAPSAGFVYDDNIEIRQNQFLQDPALLWKGLTSDSWGFKGDRGQAWSNYWRPTVIFVKAMCFRAFGLEPAGWHLVCLAAHLLAALFAYLVVLRLGASWAVAAATGWLFAAHPAHVESVVWIAAIPDPLMSIFLFGSYLLYLRAASTAQPQPAAPAAPRRSPRVAVWVAAVLLYLLGQGCKEAAILYPAIVFITALLLPDAAAAPRRIRRAMLHALPFAAAALVYLLLRRTIIASIIIPPNAAPPEALFLSAPVFLLFYLRQIFLPVWLAPLYPLQPLVAPNWLFWLALPLLALLAYGAFRLVRRARLYTLALLWLVLPLLLPLNIRVFLPEDAVHDRYLYLSVFGGVFLLALLLEAAARRLKRAHLALAGCGALALAGALRARAYAPVWSNDIALWQAGVASAPQSVYPWNQLAEAYRVAGRTADAVAALDRAEKLNPNVTDQRVLAAMLAVREGRLDDAERELRRVLSVHPDYVRAIDNLGDVYRRQGRWDDAIAVFEAGSTAAPYRKAVYTVNIAVICKLAGRTEESLRRLESARDLLRQSREPGGLVGLYYLGELHRAIGRRDEAARDFRDYLALTTALLNDPDVAARRRLSEEALRQLSGP